MLYIIGIISSIGVSHVTQNFLLALEYIKVILQFRYVSPQCYNSFKYGENKWYTPQIIGTLYEYFKENIFY